MLIYKQVTDPLTQKDEARLQKFWLRWILAFGVAWGIIPLLTLPFISRGAMDSTLDVWAVVINSLSIFPASATAFWHRRIACIWLTFNGGLVVISMTLHVLHSRDYRLGSLIGAGVSALLAILVNIAEVNRWPGALDVT